MNLHIAFYISWMNLQILMVLNKLFSPVSSFWDLLFVFCCCCFIFFLRVCFACFGGNNSDQGKIQPIQLLVRGGDYLFVCLFLLFCSILQIGFHIAHNGFKRIMQPNTDPPVFTQYYRHVYHVQFLSITFNFYVSMVKDGEHFLIYGLATCFSYLKKCTLITNTHLSIDELIKKPQCLCTVQLYRQK